MFFSTFGFGLRTTDLHFDEVRIVVVTKGWLEVLSWTKSTRQECLDRFHCQINVSRPVEIVYSTLRRSQLNVFLFFLKILCNQCNNEYCVGK